MVEQVPKHRDDARRPGCVVVGSEERRQLRVVGERLSDAPDRVGVRDDVGVHEDDDVPGRVACTRVTGSGRTGPVAALDDDQLVGPILAVSIAARQLASVGGEFVAGTTTLNVGTFRL